MSSDRLIFVIDSDALVAQLNQADTNHQKSLAIVKKIESNKIRVLYPRIILVEAITVLQRKFNKKELAYQVARSFVNSREELIELNNSIYQVAVTKYLDPNTTKKDTLFDAIVAATAEKYKADYIFSFDNFYTKCRFKLATELLK